MNMYSLRSNCSIAESFKDMDLVMEGTCLPGGELQSTLSSLKDWTVGTTLYKNVVIPYY